MLLEVHVHDEISDVDQTDLRREIRRNEEVVCRVFCYLLCLSTPTGEVHERILRKHSSLIGLQVINLCIHLIKKRDLLFSQILQRKNDTSCVDRNFFKAWIPKDNWGGGGVRSEAYLR